MKKSLSSQLVDYLKSRNVWVHSVELEDFARSHGYKSSNSGRRLRELYNSGIIERDYRDFEGVKIVWYRFKDIALEQQKIW